MLIKDCFFAKWLMVIMVMMIPMIKPAMAQTSATVQPVFDKKGQSAIVRILNKLTIEIVENKVPIGASTSLGKLRVRVFACYSNDKDDDKATAFLQIWDSGTQIKNPSDKDEKNITHKKNSAGEINVFSGWMFAASPSLSALDHAIYDVWLIRCE
ncbi:MAG: DUF2155 domain-containing protein [Alphaproteobacteria bacterium]